MQKVTKLANIYQGCFDSGTREATGKSFVFLPDNAPAELREAVQKAHGDKLPNDWIYDTFADLLCKITEYDCDTIEQLEEYRHEIVDSYVDIYTHDLTLWLHEQQALDHLSQVMAEHSYSEEDGAWQVLARTQFYAIDEIMSEIVTLLETNLDK
jgi:hypothetical protein